MAIAFGEKWCKQLLNVIEILSLDCERSLLERVSLGTSVALAHDSDARCNG